MANPTPAPTEPATFEAKAVERLQKALEELFQEVPELRSAAVVFDWQGRLNDVASPVLWLTSKGQIEPTHLGAIIGMASQAPKLLALVHHAAMSSAAIAAEQLTRLHHAKEEEAQAASRSRKGGRSKSSRKD